MQESTKLGLTKDLSQLKEDESIISSCQQSDPYQPFRNTIQQLQLENKSLILEMDKLLQKYDQLVQNNPTNIQLQELLNNKKDNEDRIATLEQSIIDLSQKNSKKKQKIRFLKGEYKVLKQQLEMRSSQEFINLLDSHNHLEVFGAHSNQSRIEKLQSIQDEFHQLDQKQIQIDLQQQKINELENQNQKLIEKIKRKKQKYQDLNKVLIQQSQQSTIVIKDLQQQIEKQKLSIQFYQSNAKLMRNSQVLYSVPQSSKAQNGNTANPFFKKQCSMGLLNRDQTSKTIVQTTMSIKDENLDSDLKYFIPKKQNNLQSRIQEMRKQIQQYSFMRSNEKGYFLKRQN